VRAAAGADRPASATSATSAMVLASGRIDKNANRARPATALTTAVAACDHPRPDDPCEAVVVAPGLVEPRACSRLTRRITAPTHEPRTDPSGVHVSPEPVREDES
jgi:hypothetical protein